jgi:hypothetical protein
MVIGKWLIALNSATPSRLFAQIALDAKSDRAKSASPGWLPKQRVAN